ncbi:MAG: hypothetical protein J3R72DRAFT_445245 [Linnemannia gamsii]|nr:MAG: hypothetical protein J3R72DRAFT_445245 [Linnemannia gamsii]
MSDRCVLSRHHTLFLSFSLSFSLALLFAFMSAASLLLAIAHWSRLESERERHISITHVFFSLLARFGCDIMQSNRDEHWGTCMRQREHWGRWGGGEKGRERERRSVTSFFHEYTSYHCHT